MTILVTGTSGQLGRLVVQALLDRGVAADRIVATARDIAAVGDLAARGVVTRAADYEDPASLDASFAGVDTALLVSSNAIGQRVAQHRNVIEAAARAGVALLAYTSLLGVDTSDLILAAEHKATEDLLRASGMPHALLRNGWYLENHTAQLPTDVIHGSAGDGQISGAARADYAEAAAVVLTAPGQAGKVYELGGDTAFTLADLAAEASAQSGSPVTYRDLSPADHVAALTAAGLPAPFAEVLADSDRGVREGRLRTTSRDLSTLIGRPTTPLSDAVKAALA